MKLKGETAAAQSTLDSSWRELENTWHLAPIQAVHARHWISVCIGTLAPVVLKSLDFFFVVAHVP